MDVERIQKINTLALDLLKQGLAGDREEAVIMAEKIFRNRDGDNSVIRETMQAVKTHASVQSGSMNSQSEMSQDSIKQILEQNTKFIVTKFKEIQDKLAALEQEIGTIKSNVRHAASTNHPQIQPSNPQLRGSASAPSSQSAPSGTSGNHPRSGNYSAQDVSIEKFFYMGSK